MSNLQQQVRQLEKQVDYYKSQPQQVQQQQQQPNNDAQIYDLQQQVAQL
jgi:hypothetical protein